MDIEEAMGKLIEPIQKKMVAIGFLIEAEAKRNCPVDLGRLRASITTNWSKSELGIRSGKQFSLGPGINVTASSDGVGEPKAKENEFVVVIGSNVEYAPYPELGTGIYAEGGGGRQTPWIYPIGDGFRWTNGMRPIAYLRRAFEKYRSKIMNLGKV